MVKAGNTLEDANKTIENLVINCFTGDTLVCMADGFKPISEVQIGDFVRSKDVLTGELHIKEVLEIYKKMTREFVKIGVTGKSIQTTPGHLFFTDSGWW